MLVPNVVNDSETVANVGKSIDTIYKNTIPQYLEELNFAESKILNEIEILLPKIDNQNITRDFINAFVLSIYIKNSKNIQLNINIYKDIFNLDYSWMAGSHWVALYVDMNRSKDICFFDSYGSNPPKEIKKLIGF